MHARALCGDLDAAQAILLQALNGYPQTWDLRHAQVGVHQQRGRIADAELCCRGDDDLRPRVLGNSGLARAVEYTEKRWPGLPKAAAIRSTTTPSKTPSARSPSAARTGCSPNRKPRASALPPS